MKEQPLSKDNFLWVFQNGSFFKLLKSKEIIIYHVPLQDMPQTHTDKLGGIISLRRVRT